MKTRTESALALAFIVAYGAAIGYGGWWISEEFFPAPDKTLHAVVISDDDPRFDCATMGNRVCGVNPEAWYAAGELVGIAVIES